MFPLRRHQLARLSAPGWAPILRRSWDGQALDCLAHWATHQLPLVVTRQSIDATTTDGSIALGLPAPALWGRRRLALQVPRTAVLLFDEFPHLAEVRRLLPQPARRAVRDLLGALDACGAKARVFGSYGWQAISGLDHARPESDLDLSVAVEGVVHADAVARVLQSFSSARPRLDGELLFGDGAAVAWREWAQWRAGRTQAVMVKRLDSVSLQRDITWCERAALEELAA